MSSIWTVMKDILRQRRWTNKSKGLIKKICSALVLVGIYQFVWNHPKDFSVFPRELALCLWLLAVGHETPRSSLVALSLLGIPSPFQLVLFLCWQAQFLSFQNFGDVQVKEIAVEDSLHHSSHNGNHVKEALKVETPDPVEEIERSIHA